MSGISGGPPKGRSPGRAFSLIMAMAGQMRGTDISAETGGRLARGDWWQGSGKAAQ